MGWLTQLRAEGRIVVLSMSHHTSLSPPQTDMGDLLLFNHVPFAEDLREYAFAPLPTPTTDASHAALKLIDTMDLSATEYVLCLHTQPPHESSVGKLKGLHWAHGLTSSVILTLA
jgi:hypothetical protein